MHKQIEPRVCCTRCGGLDHFAAFCPTAVAMAAGAAASPVADTEVEGDSTGTAGEPLGDSPAGPVDNPEDTGEFLEDTRRWTLSQAEGRDIPNPPDVHGVCPTGEAIAAAVADENYARYRASSSIKQKGYNKGKHADHVKGKSRSPATKHPAKARTNKAAKPTSQNSGCEAIQDTMPTMAQARMPSVLKASSYSG